MFDNCKISARFMIGRCLVLLFLTAFVGVIPIAAAQSPTSKPVTKSGTIAVSNASPAAGTVAGTNLGATPPRMRGTTMAQRKAAAAHAAQRRAASPQSFSRRAQVMGVNSNAIAGQPGGVTMAPADLYFSGTYPNYANSPLPNPNDPNCSSPNFCGIRKFVNTLPGLNTSNDLGQQIQIATPDKTTFPGSDYYEISLVQFQTKMHTDLPPTWVRGYVQTVNGVPVLKCSVNGTPSPCYDGPQFIATSGRAVRIKFTNNLPTGTTPGPISMTNGNLFIPVDTSEKGSGIGIANGVSAYLQNRATIHMHGGNTPWISDGTPHQWTVPKGNFTDGSTTYPRGDSVSPSFVPDMFFHADGTVIPQCSGTVITACSGGTKAQLPADATNDPGQGSLVFYYTNQQSARLLFYHDHSYGTTRLNVYAGEAGGYLIQDQVETDLTTGTNVSGVFTAAGLAPAPVVPSVEIPLIIQDKTFVPPSPTGAPVYSVPMLENGSGYTTATVTFSGGGCTTLPSATASVGLMTNPWGQFVPGAVTGITLVSGGVGCQSDPVVTITGNGTGAAAYASLATLSQQDPTWDTTLWGGPGNFWYPHVYMPNQFPDNPDGSAVNPMGRWDYASWFWPVFTSQYQVRGEISCGTSLMMPASYNTAAWACPGTPSALNPGPDVDLAGNIALGRSVSTGSGSTASLTPEAFMDTPVVNGTAYPTLTVDPEPVRFRVLSIGNDRSLNLSWFLACGQFTPSATNYGCPTPAFGTGIPYFTEVGMVPAAPGLGYPIWWPTDGRDGGVPDPLGMGPDWIQIGTEGGILPAPVDIPPAPINYEYNRRSVTVTNTSSHSLNMMPAERADVIVDFTKFAGRTLILYNDAPAPYPAFDSRYDYYTGDPDQSGMGGAPTTYPGFGPNTRTVMQVVVRSSISGPTTPAVNMANLTKLLGAAFKLTQPIPIVPQPVYSSIYNPGATAATTTATNPAGPAYIAHLPHLADTQMTFSPIGAVAPTPGAAVPTVTLPMRNKTIQELFELDYGRMNSTLGTELALTNFNTQTTIPLGYVDPFTEDIYDTNHLQGAISTQLVGATGDGSQIWEVIHNGVDSHAIHFHLYNVQILDRVGWDGTTRSPDPNEYGWKDTVRMNPLEIDFVAIRPMSMDLPFPVPDSTRLLDVTRPAGPDPDMSAFNPQNNNTGAGINSVVTMGWEYVWHCHILGHEENDMMREQTFQVPPQAPTGLTVSGTGIGDTISFTDMSLSETGFNVQRADDALFTTNLINLPDIAANAGWNLPVPPFTDRNGTAGQAYYYRVRSFKPDADYWNPIIGDPALNIPTGPMPNLTSAWVSAHTILVPTATVNPTSLAFLPQLINTASTSQSFTLTNTGLASLTVTGISVTGSSYFTQTNTCGTLPKTILAGGAGCTITVTFSPLTVGLASANVAIASNDPATPLNVALTGYGQTPLTITAPTLSIGYGSPVPVITPILTGLVSGDTVASLVGLTCTTTYTPTSKIGSNQTASCSDAVNTNYVITYVPGKVTVTAVPASLTTPTPGTILPGSNVTFTWTSGAGVTAYTLYLGTTGAGSSNLYNSGYLTSTSATATGLPTSGVTIYARLYSLINGVYQTKDYTYIAAGTPVPAVLTTPAPTSTLLGSTVTFTWTPGTGVTAYTLYLGTTGVGSSNLYYGGYLTSTSATATGLPTNGVKIYARLYSLINGVWQFKDYTYTAF